MVVNSVGNLRVPRSCWEFLLQAGPETPLSALGSGGTRPRWTRLQTGHPCSESHPGGTVSKLTKSPVSRTRLAISCIAHSPTSLQNLFKLEPTKTCSCTEYLVNRTSQNSYCGKQIFRSSDEIQNTHTSSTFPSPLFPIPDMPVSGNT